MNKRPSSTASPLARVFGWSRTFHRAELPSGIVALLEQAAEVEADQGKHEEYDVLADGKVAGRIYEDASASFGQHAAGVAMVLVDHL